MPNVAFPALGFPVWDCDSPLPPRPEDVYGATEDGGPVTTIGLPRGRQGPDTPWVHVYSFSPDYPRSIGAASYTGAAFTHLIEVLTAGIASESERRRIAEDLGMIPLRDHSGRPGTVRVLGRLVEGAGWQVGESSSVFAAITGHSGLAIARHLVPELPALVDADPTLWGDSIADLTRLLTPRD